MADLVPGSVQYAYNRMYVVVQPNLQGPPTYRVSNPDEIAGPGGGGGTGGDTAYDFGGVKPINVNTVPGVGSNPTVVETSMDIAQLDDRAT